jgi:hypothetical protein
LIVGRNSECIAQAWRTGSSTAAKARTCIETPMGKGKGDLAFFYDNLGRKEMDGMCDVDIMVYRVGWDSDEWWIVLVSVYLALLHRGRGFFFAVFAQSSGVYLGLYIMALQGRFVLMLC